MIFLKLNFCETTSAIWQFIGYFLIALKIAIPLVLIVLGIIDLSKAVVANDNDQIKKSTKTVARRLLIGILIFFIPTIVNFLFKLIKQAAPTMNEIDACKTCLLSALSDECDDYKEQARIDREARQEELNNATIKLNYKCYKCSSLYKWSNIEQSGCTVVEELDTKEKCEALNEGNGNNVGEGSSASGTPLEAASFQNSTTKVGEAGVELNEEPHPAEAINYWSDYVSADDFVYPLDKNGNQLGAWPKNYAEIPTQLTNYKTYNNGLLIIPVTPTNGIYTSGYDHKGMDITATFGTPIYSPADGTLIYSTWGKTVNTGGDETAYSVGLKFEENKNINGKILNRIFLTHMSGIRYRCTESTCNNQKIKKGELLGFIGNGTSSATSVGWVPHLHMSIFYDNYSSGTHLLTEEFEKIYYLTSGDSITAGG